MSEIPDRPIFESAEWSAEKPWTLRRGGTPMRYADGTPVFFRAYAIYFGDTFICAALDPLLQETAFLVAQANAAHARGGLWPPPVASKLTDDPRYA